MASLRNPINLDRLLFVLFVGILVWLPLPLGSNRTWAWTLIEVAVLITLGLALIFSSMLRGRLLGQTRELKAVLLLFLAWLAYTVFQTFDLGGALNILDPETAKLYATVSVWVGPRPNSIAIDQVAALDEIVKQLTYISLFILTLILASSRRRLRTLALILTGVGLVEAAYGLVILLAGDTIDIWRPKWLGHEVVTGTFVNRNHYAAHIAMTLSLGLGLLFSDFYRYRLKSHGTKQRLRNLIALVVGPRFAGFLALTVMVSALILSQSRGGILAIFGGLTVVTLLGLLWHRESSVERSILVVVALLVVSAVYWKGTGSLLERIENVSVEKDERVQVWMDTLDMIADRPMFGVGAGNYVWGFTAYREGARPEVYVNHAHNDYLELMAEYGLVGSILAGLPVLLILSRMLDGFRDRHDPLSRGMLFGTLSACVAFLFHAIVDFNFHIPANAGYFFVLLGMGWVAARIEHPSRANVSDQPSTFSVASASSPGKGKSRGRTALLERKT